MLSATMPNESWTPPTTSGEQAQLEAFFALVEAEAVAQGENAERLTRELKAVLSESTEPERKDE